MTEERLVLSELLEKAGEGDFLRTVAEAVLQLLMETDVEGLIGAGRYERNGERTTWRNGHRDRTLDTRLGALQLRIPKLRQGCQRRRESASAGRSKNASRAQSFSTMPNDAFQFDRDEPAFPSRPGERWPRRAA